jgi:hypothetical protein
MASPLKRIETASSDIGYIERNRRWLFPVFAGFTLLAAHAIGKVIVGKSGAQNPLSFSIMSWFVAMAFIVAGLGAWMTDTASARIVAGAVATVAMVAGAFGLVVVFWSILEIISG